MRRILLIASLSLTLAGCSKPNLAPSAAPPPETATATVTPAAPAKAPAPTPAAPTTPDVNLHPLGDGWVLNGVKQPTAIAWAPSGRIAAVTGVEAAYLIDLDQQSVQPLPEIKNARSLTFWSENELTWIETDGETESLMARDLKAGQSRVFFPFGGRVEHFLAPGDRQAIFLRVKGVTASPPVTYGEVVAGGRTVVPEGHLIGRLADGRVLAVTAPRHGALVAVRPDGGVESVSPLTCFFPAVSADGSRALWFTGPGKAGDAEPLADTLWLWSGKGMPVSVSLGGQYAVRALFSPDSSRIAMELHDPDYTKPGQIAVVENGALRTLLKDAHALHVQAWLGDSLLFLRTQMEKTGGQVPGNLLSMEGKETRTPLLLSAANMLVSPTMEIWWPGTAEHRQVGGAQAFNFLAARPSDPFLAVIEKDQLQLRALK